jgi:ankyrin repeat protein
MTHPFRCIGSGQNVNTVYSESGGQTPLHAACHGGHLAIVHIIVQSGAALDRMDSSQKTALVVAVVQGHNEIAKYLIQIGACTSLKVVIHINLDCLEQF